MLIESNVCLLCLQYHITDYDDNGDLHDSLTGNHRFHSAVNRARSVMNLYDKAPVLGRNVFIAPNALVSGDVRVGNNSSVFYGSVVRGTQL